MDAFNVESTSFTPKILFDADSCLFEFSGISRPEDVMLFYEPVLVWLDEYHDSIDTIGLDTFSGKTIKFIFKFVYFNSASAKYLLRILDRTEKLSLRGLNVEIEWHYDKEDEQMKEDGEDLSEAIDIKFTFLAH